MQTNSDGSPQSLLYATGMDSVAEASVVGVAIIDGESTCVYVNDALCRLAGKTREQLLGLGREEIFESGARGHLRVRSEVISEGSDEVGSIITAVEMGRSPQAARGFTAVEDLMEALIGTANDAVVVIDDAGEILSASESCRALFGWPREELVGVNLSLLMKPQDASSHQLHVDRYLSSGEPVALGRRRRVEAIRRDGTSMAIEIRVVESPSEAGTRFIGFIRDLSEIDELRSRVSRVEDRDALTGLLTHSSFELALAESIEPSDDPWSLVKIDVANFHYVNTAHGHHTGDDLLRAIAREIESVAPRGPIGRTGGDRFGFVVATERLDQVVRVLRSRIAARGRSRGISHPVKLHVGVCSLSGRENADILMASADSAIREAKRTPWHLYVAYDEELREAVVTEARLAGEIHRAVSHGELVTYFQREVDLADNKIIGHEALVRWRHPEDGLIAPDRFLPMATSEGLMPALGVQVFAASLDFVHKSEHIGHPGRVWVNLSAGQLFDDSVVQYAKSAVEFGVSPDRLGFEITEQVALTLVSSASKNLELLRDMGIAIAIDDFGTGYSSLSQLRHVPADVVKLDRSFLTDIHEVQRQRDFVGACIDLAHTLDLKVIVEGVESQADASLMADLGCESAQGYYFGRPVPAEEALGAL